MNNRCVVHRTLSQRAYDAVLRVQADVLNTESPSTPPPQERLDIALKLHVARIQAEAIDAATGSIDYTRLRTSAVYAQYRALTAHLRAFDLHQLTDEADKKAFWLNLYNVLVIDGIIAYGVRESVQEVRGFFRRVAYCVGGWRFNLDDIEHGILRANRPHPLIPQKQFGARDPRRALMLKALDNRIHFALVCGARSCPPIRFYDAGQVDAQLEMAARHFVAETVHSDAHSITLSKIGQWYGEDFGAGAWLKAGIGDPLPVLNAFCGYLPEAKAHALADKLAGGAKVRFAPYDWTLNAL